MSDIDIWLTRQPARGERRLRMFCFPFAGGGAQIYHNYARELPAGIEVCAVQLPGRERRFSEPALTRVAETVACMLPIMRQMLDLPYVIFGHSLGALTGFELTRSIRAAGLPLPLELIVSGHRAPQLPDLDPPVHDLPEHELIQELTKLNGTPAEVFESPELVELMLPLLRADFAAAETYLYTEQMPLECPVTAFGGDSDPLVSPAEIEAWRVQTSGAFAHHILAGDHFFFQQDRDGFLRALGGVMGTVLSGLAAGGNTF